MLLLGACIEGARSRASAHLALAGAATWGWAAVAARRLSSLNGDDITSSIPPTPELSFMEVGSMVKALIAPMSWGDMFFGVQVRQSQPVAAGVKRLMGNMGMVSGYMDACVADVVERGGSRQAVAVHGAVAI